MVVAGPWRREAEVESRWIFGAGQVLEPWVAPVHDPVPRGKGEQGRTCSMHERLGYSWDNSGQYLVLTYI